MNSIAGNWRVIDGEIYDAESATHFTLCAGSLRYEGKGTFAASCVLVAPNAAPTEGGDAATQVAYDYSGNYEVDAARGIIVHHILSSSFPDDVGTTVYRSYERKEAFLSVAFPVAAPGAEFNRASSHGFISLEREEP